MFFKLALRNIFRNRTRSLITLSAIATSAVTLILAGGFIQDAVMQVRESYIRDFLGHVRIYKTGFAEHGRLHPFDYMISNPDDLARQIRALPHVQYCAPRLGFAGLLSSGDATISFFGEGRDPAQEGELERRLPLVAGQLLSANSAYEVLLGKGLAEALSASVGDSLVIVTNTKHGSLNAADVKIQGTFNTTDKSADDHSARLPLGIAQKLLRTPDVQMMVIFLDSTANTELVKQNIQDLLRRQGLDYQTKAWHELNESDFVHKVIAFYSRMFLILKIIIVIVVTLGVFNTMNMAVLERIGEIGTLMALGTRRTGIATLFLIEGGLLGFFGGFVGCILGVALALLISKIGIPMPSPPGTAAVWIARIALVPSALVFAFGVAMATSFISAILPAMKASHLEVAEALRHNL